MNGGWWWWEGSGWVDICLERWDTPDGRHCWGLMNGNLRELDQETSCEILFDLSLDYNSFSSIVSQKKQSKRPEIDGCGRKAQIEVGGIVKLQHYERKTNTPQTRVQHLSASGWSREADELMSDLPICELVCWLWFWVWSPPEVGGVLLEPPWGAGLIWKSEMIDMMNYTSRKH